MEVEDPENYSELKVLRSNNGYYIGTTYTDPKDGFVEPGSRDSGYFKTRDLAEAVLKSIELKPSEAIHKLRLHP